jgi:orotidine 5'-phosphate decarboxylase subfamily 2
MLVQLRTGASSPALGGVEMSGFLKVGELMTYFDTLRASSVARDSLLCIGLDPDQNLIPGGLEEAVDFCRRLIDATSDIACCYKPNAAFWEQYGPHGWEGLLTVRQWVPPDVPVILDCKRADVPNTMAAYAAAVFDAMQFDAATVHAYHGVDSVSVFTRYTNRGVYVVCHTSNPGRDDLQHLPCNNDALFMAVAGLAVRSANGGNVGVIMGATAPIEAAAVRARFSTLPFLLPGIGQQGGDLDGTVRASFTGDPASCLIAVAGAIMYADDCRGAAISWRDRIRRACGRDASSRT